MTRDDWKSEGERYGLGGDALEVFVDMMLEHGAERPPLDSVVVAGRRWRSSTGNTYHSVEVFVDGVLVAQGYAYGYGSAYQDTAIDLLTSHFDELRDARASTEAPHRFWRRLGVKYEATVVDVARRADL